MAGDDQRRRVLRHRLADVARRLAAGANLLRQRAVGGRAAPADAAQGVINPGEERVLAGEVEPNLREVRLLAVKVPLRRRNDRGDVFRRRARLRALERGGGSAVRRPPRSSPAIESARPPHRSRRWRRSPSRFRRRDSLRSSRQFPCHHGPRMRRPGPNSTRFLRLHPRALMRALRSMVHCRAPGGEHGARCSGARADRAGRLALAWRDCAASLCAGRRLRIPADGRRALRDGEPNSGL